jgi:hypothetical protein
MSMFSHVSSLVRFLPLVGRSHESSGEFVFPDSNFVSAIVHILIFESQTFVTWPSAGSSIMCSLRMLYVWPPWW